MSKINDNTYVNKIKKEIMEGTFATKEDLMSFLIKNRQNVLNDPFFNQELNDSFIKLNLETMSTMEKELLEFYDKRKNNDLNSLNLEGVSGFQVDDKDYIKYKDKDGNISVIDNSLSNRNFVQEFQNRQNNLDSNSQMDADKSKEEIMNQITKEKVNVNLSSSNDVNVRDLTVEEKRQFASIMHLPDADNINFLVEPTRNIYINKDTGETYFVNKNQYGELEVHKANEVTSKTEKEESAVINNEGQEQQVTMETPVEPKFEELGDSDLEYIYENKLNTLTLEQQERLKEIIKERREKQLEQSSLEQNKVSEKQFVKKLDNALHTPYNGFVSLVFLCSTVGFFALGFLMLIMIKLNIS